MDLDRIYAVLAAQEIITKARLDVAREHGMDNPFWETLFHASTYLNGQLKVEYLK